MPIAVTASAAFLGGMGAGWIKLPDEEWAQLWGIPLFVFAMEIADYFFHRAQHAWPALWSMHSLHHSDSAFGVTTSARLFWAESLIRAVFVYPVVLILLMPSSAALVIYDLILLWGYVTHLNVRFCFGRFALILTSPQYHRIHHAADRNLLDRNFAAVFPVIDLLFGTCYAPTRGEYPATGLVGGHEPRNVLEAALWPFIGASTRVGGEERQGISHKVKRRSRSRRNLHRRPCEKHARQKREKKVKALAVLRRTRFSDRRAH